MRQFIVSEDDFVIDERFSGREIQENQGIEAAGEVKSRLGVVTEVYGGEEGFHSIPPTKMSPPMPRVWTGNYGPRTCRGIRMRCRRSAI
jgi:hypothetical protein